MHRTEYSQRPAFASLRVCVAIFLAGFLLLQACLRLVGTLGRFYGWDA